MLLGFNSCGPSDDKWDGREERPRYDCFAASSAIPNVRNFKTAVVAEDIHLSLIHPSNMNQLFIKRFYEFSISVALVVLLTRPI